MEKSHTVYSKKTKMLHLFMEVFLILVAALTLYPLIYIMFGSFKENAELLRGGTKLLPEKFVLENYKQAWHKANFARYTLNSVVISVGVQYGWICVRKEEFQGKGASLQPVCGLHVR